MMFCCDASCTAIGTCRAGWSKRRKPGEVFCANFRASGTEPLIRCYIEAKSRAHLKKLQTACREVLV
jgi:hypothetical protein